MNAYIIALLCLTSIIVVTTKDAVMSRNQFVLLQSSDSLENVHATAQSAFAEAKYHAYSKAFALPPTKGHISSSNKKPSSKNSKHKVYSLRVPFTRPPNNSRLNIYSLLTESSEQRDGSLSWYAIFIRFLQHAYVSSGVLEPGYEKTIVDTLIERKDEILQKAEEGIPDGIAAIEFQDQKLQQSWYRMLKGNDTMPSVLNYLNYSSKKGFENKLNLLFMDPMILSAILNHHEAFTRIDALRTQIWHTVKQQELAIQEKGKEALLEGFRNRTDFRIELKEKTEALLQGYYLVDLLDKKLFDYTLGSQGDFLFVVDPETGWITRCRCSSSGKKR